MNTPESTLKQDEKKAKSWLQSLKDESWEAELLVSAIAIYGTFQLFGLINWWTNMFIDWLPESQYFIGYMIVFFGLFAISSLVSMFVIHFILRAYWIGLVGLNSVFPDYGLEDSVYSKIYTKKLLAILPKIKNTIITVDELCSVIFSAAFTFMLTYFYMALVASVYLLLFNYLTTWVSEWVLLIPVILFLILLAFQAILTVIANLKMNKEKEWLQNLFFVFVKNISKILYGPFFKIIMQIAMIFGSNFKKKKSLVSLILLFALSGMVVTVLKINSTNIPHLIGKNKVDKTRSQSYYYQENNVNSDFLLAPEIASAEIKSKVLKLFIPHFNHEDKILDATYGEYVDEQNRSREENRDNRSAYYLKTLNKYHKVMLNGKPITVEFLKYDHPKTKQFGLIGYVPLENPKKGKNEITVIKDAKSDNTKEWTIPFYYVGE